MEDQRPQVVVSVQVMDGQYDDVMITGLDLLGDAGFDPAAGAFEQDGAVLGDPPVQPVEPPFAAGRQLPADVFLPSGQDADAEPDTSERRDQVRDVRAIQTETSAGSSETDVKEFAVSPMGSSPASAATAVTPVGKAPKTRRSRA